MITIEQLKIIMPRAGRRADAFAPYLDAAMSEFNISSKFDQVAFLATICVESGQLIYMQEIADGSAYENRKDLGNTRPEAIEIARRHGSTPGRWWKGHCPLQISGHDNHKECGEALGLDLLNNPLLIIQPEHGMRAAAWFWDHHNLKKWADAEDWDGVRDVVNKGHKTAKIGDANGYAEFLHAVARGSVVIESLLG